MVERQLCKLDVIGSIPIGSTSRRGAGVQRHDDSSETTRFPAVRLMASLGAELFDNCICARESM